MDGTSVRLQGGGYKERRQPGGRQQRHTQGFGMCFCFSGMQGGEATKTMTNPKPQQARKARKIMGSGWTDRY